MKTINIIILSLIFTNIFSQNILEKEVKTEVNEVTVFLDGAQIVRKAAVDLTKGITIIKFVNLSPFIDAKSLQIKAEGELTVLSVNHQQNYIDKIVKSSELIKIEKQLETIENNITLEHTYLSIIKEELAFLKENRNINGKNEQVNISNLQQTAEFYSNKLTALKMKEIERNKTLKSLIEQKSSFQNQIKTLSSKKEYPTSEILVKVETKQSNRYLLELNYMVGNAGWFPSYDIRAKNINEPVQLIYKANVKQDTKVDWSNVKLKFSSATPSISGVAPTLRTYFLNYNSLPPTYKLIQNSVRGRVIDNTGNPLPGANVMVEGTTIGTITDMNGNYSITVPDNSNQLNFSFIGFNSQILPITNPVMNITLQEDAIELQELVSISMSKNMDIYIAEEDASNEFQRKATGVNTDKSDIKTRGTNSLAIPTAQVENQTTVDFEINTPYTVKSDNKNYTVDMEFYDLPAIYQYYCVPKIDKDAFLIASIIDWEKYNLLEGEANIFFENTYIGKTLIDVRYTTDTLEISLGRDKKVSVNREKNKDFTNKQFFGNKKEETRVWKTTVKNNKNQTINMIILDQVPVSTIEEIEVIVQNASGAKRNLETGEIKWEFKLKPNDNKEVELKYSVKYPKTKKLIVD